MPAPQNKINKRKRLTNERMRTELPESIRDSNEISSARCVALHLIIYKLIKRLLLCWVEWTIYSYTSGWCLHGQCPTWSLPFICSLSSSSSYSSHSSLSSLSVPFVLAAVRVACDRTNWSSRKRNRCKRVFMAKKIKMYYPLLINIKCLLFKMKN